MPGNILPINGLTLTQNIQPNLPINLHPSIAAFKQAIPTIQDICRANQRLSNPEPVTITICKPENIVDNAFLTVPITKQVKAEIYYGRYYCDDIYELMDEISEMVKEIPVSKKVIEDTDEEGKVTKTVIEEIKNIIGELLGYKSKSETSITDPETGEKRIIQEVEVGEVEVDKCVEPYYPKEDYNFNRRTGEKIMPFYYNYDYVTKIRNYDKEGNCDETVIKNNDSEYGGTEIIKNNVTNIFDRNGNLTEILEGDNIIFVNKSNNPNFCTKFIEGGIEKDYSVETGDSITGKITGDTAGVKDEIMHDKNGQVIYSKDETKSTKEEDFDTASKIIEFYNTVNGFINMEYDNQNSNVHIMADNPNCHLETFSKNNSQYEIKTSDNSISQTHSTQGDTEIATCKTPQAERNIINNKESRSTTFTIRDSKGNILVDSSNKKYFNEDGNGYIQIKKINGQTYAYSVSFNDKGELIVKTAKQGTDGNFTIEDECGIPLMDSIDSNGFKKEGLFFYSTPMETSFGKFLLIIYIQLTKPLLLELDAQDIILAIKNGLKFNNSSNNNNNNSYFHNQSVIELKMAAKSVSTEHELGHFKNKLYGTSQNKSIRDIYEKELLKVDNHDKYWIRYFLDTSDAAESGLNEIVAETNAMQNSNRLDCGSYIRTAMLQKYFPETIAAIINYQNKQE